MTDLFVKRLFSRKFLLSISHSATVCRMNLTISKRVPARTKTLTAAWCKRDFMQMGPVYRDARARSRNPMDSCYWCDHKIADGEMIALACFEGIGNKVLCQPCADELLASDKV